MNTPAAGPMSLLEVRDLHTRFRTEEAEVRAVDGVSFTVEAGQTLGLVGESGSGKSATAMSILGLVRPAGRVTSGAVLMDGRDLTSLSERELRGVRGKQIGMIFQEPMTSLNPVLKIGDQITEGIRLHEGLDRAAADARALELLDLVGIPSPRERLTEYPHRLSGGMRQRVMIAMALACRPQLLIADEPTTALDVTVQAQILDLLRDLQRELGMAILLITHDLGVVARMCDRVAVMYAGRIVEEGTWSGLHADPQHPYTQGLLQAVPGPEVPRGQRLAVIPGEVPDPSRWPAGCRFAPRCALRIERCESEDPELVDHHGRLVACHRAGERVPPQTGSPTTAVSERSEVREEAPDDSGAPQAALLEVTDLVTHIPLGRGWFGRPRAVVRAVDGVSLSLSRGETLGLVGESGSGKSTLARSVLRLQPHTSGSIRFDGRDISDLSERELRPLRPGMQMVFQDPAASLNPRLRVDQIIGEALDVHGIGERADRSEAVAAVLEKVGLRPEHARRYPHEFSGGQRQRIGIARAVVLNPDLIVADEPVSALDVSVQSQVLNLMADLRADLGVAYVFIAHNLHVVRHVSDRIAVMYLGRLVEVGGTDQIMSAPAHPYTRALLEAVPDPDPGRISEHAPLTGEIPSPLDPPTGCRFRTRCPLARTLGTADGICRDEAPALRALEDGRQVACHFAEEEELGEVD